MEQQSNHHRLTDWGILAVLWMVAAGVDQLWLAIDRSVPSWDPADHLIGALNYWWTLQPQHWFTGEIWTALWTLSSKYPPLLYVSTAPFLAFFGKGADSATLVNLLYTAILLVSVYGLGRVLFRPAVGLWAAALCLLFPQFYSLRTDYFMDYPLATLVAASSLLLTLWYRAQGGLGEVLAGRSPESRSPLQSLSQWNWAVGFGLSFGVALLMKQTAIFFLAVPLLWLGLRAMALGIRKGRWSQLGQWLVALALPAVMMLPWSQTNWLFQISAAFNANVRSARIEGDPAWNTVAAWQYYWQSLPVAVSYPLLVVAVVGVLIGLGRWLKQGHSSVNVPHPVGSARPAFLWLALFLLPTYAIWSAFANKDTRYIMPWLPWWSVLLAYGLLSFPQKWRRVKWLTVGVAVAVMMVNLFPLGGGMGRAIAQTLAPGADHQPYLGAPWPHDEIIEEIIATQPYQMANIGVLPSTPEISQHNLTLAGNRHNFQVYARRMAKDRDFLERDMRSLSWFISITPPNLNHHEESSRKRQRDMLALIKQSGDFTRHRVWELPDGSRLRLFRRKTLPVEVEPMDNAIANVLYDEDQLQSILSLVGPPVAPRSATSTEKSVADVVIQPMKVQLEAVTVPQRVPPGSAVPVSYRWAGSWSMLHDGLIFLSWQRLLPNASQSPASQAPTSQAPASQLKQDVFTPERETGANGSAPVQRWVHDHAIGLGTLYPQVIQANQAIAAPAKVDPLKPFWVTEHTAMQLPDTLRPGRYGLQASYLNKATGESYAVDVPSVVLTVRPQARPKPAPEPDWITQFRQAARQLPEGIDALNAVFEDVGRMNLYDPVQAYTQDAEAILTERLRHHPDQPEAVYGLALAHALQRDVSGTMAAMEQAAQLDADNPYVHAQLAFVKLYAGRPWSAQRSLDKAMQLDPTVPEIQTLNTVAALLRGNLWEAWHRYQELA